MANYIPWYGKKRERLAQREDEFDTLLLTETNLSCLADGAEMIRAAHVRALKSRRAQLPPSEKYADAIANINQEIQFWLALTVEQIIEGHRTGKLKGLRPTAVRNRT